MILRHSTSLSLLWWGMFGVLFQLPLLPAEELRSCASPIRPQDEVWLVSTRGLPAVCRNVRPQLYVLRYSPVNGWRHSSMQELLAARRTKASTLMYIHGNRVDWNWSLRRGLESYQALTRDA